MGKDVKINRKGEIYFRELLLRKNEDYETPPPFMIYEVNTV